MSDIIDKTVSELSQTGILANVKYNPSPGKRYTCTPRARKQFQPFEHQNRVLTFFNQSPHRGLILKHGLGTGKTCSSIMIVDDFLSRDNNAIAYILSSGSLRENFINEYCRLCGKNRIRFENRIYFMSYNFTGIYEQVYGKVERRNTIFVIDEFHNIINGKVFNGKQKSSIYDFVYNSLKVNQKSRCILLSGTPFYSNVMEIEFSIKMLKQEQSNDELFKKYRDMTLSKDSLKYQNINNELDKDASTIGNLFNGIISSVNSLNVGKRPELFEIEEVYVPLSEYQEYYYKIIRDKEKKVSNALQEITGEEARLNPALKKFIDTLIYIYKNMLKSRPILNFCYSKNIMNAIVESIINKKKREDVEKEVESEFIDLEDVKKNEVTDESEYIDLENIKGSEVTDESEFIELENVKVSKVTLVDSKATPVASLVEEIVAPENKILFSDLIGTDYPITWATKEEFKEIVDDLPKYSPKMNEIIKKIRKYPNNKHMIYSQFITRHGINIFCSILEVCGITFIKYTGEIQGDSHRRYIIDKFNSDSNMYGQEFQVIFVSKAGTEGISLKHVNFVHILGPEINYNTVVQAIGRATRSNSHEGMDGELAWKVYPFLYISKLDNEKTSDEIILQKSKDKYKITEKLSQITEQYSIENLYNIDSKQTVTFFNKEITSGCNDDLSCNTGCCVKGTCRSPDECVQRNKKLVNYKKNVDFELNDQKYINRIRDFVKLSKPDLTEEQVDAVTNKLIDNNTYIRQTIFERIQKTDPNLSDDEVNSLTDKYMNRKRTASGGGGASDASYRQILFKKIKENQPNLSDDKVNSLVDKYIDRSRAAASGGDASAASGGGASAASGGGASAAGYRQNLFNRLKTIQPNLSDDKVNSLVDKYMDRSRAAASGADASAASGGDASAASGGDASDAGYRQNLFNRLKTIQPNLSDDKVNSLVDKYMDRIRSKAP